MTAKLREVHVLYDRERRQWCVEEYRPGVPRHDVPISRDWRWLKWVALWVAVGTAKNGSPCELFVHGKSGRIQSRRTYPRKSDPRGRG